MIPTPAIENKWSRSPVPLLTASLFLSLLYCPPVDIFFDDKEIFRYIGRLIAHGGVPYRDVFDHKPPLIYFFNLFGPWGLWTIDTALVLLATLLFYRLCRRKDLPFAWLLPLLFNLLIRNYLVCMGIGMTRAYTAIFLLLFFCSMMARSPQRYFWMGLLTAATLFMQQDQLLPLLPFFAYAFLTVFSSRDARPSLRSRAPNVQSSARDARTPPHFTAPNIRPPLLAIAGFATLALPLIIYFAAHHSLAAVWMDAFQFNFSWYTEKTPLSVHFRTIKAALGTTGCLMPFILAMTLGVTALFLRHKQKPLLIAALLTVCLSFIADFLSEHAFYYYLLPLSASLPILVYTVYTGTEEPFLLDRKNRLLYGFLLCCLPLYNSLQHATHLSTRNADLITSTPEFTWLRQQHPSDHQLYVFNNSNWAYAYNRLDIMAPSPWIYHYFWEWYPHWDNDHRLIRSIGDDLLRNKTRFVMDYSDDLHFRDPQNHSIWKDFLEKYYKPVPLPGTYRQLLWEIKTPA